MAEVAVGGRTVGDELRTLQQQLEIMQRQMSQIASRPALSGYVPMTMSGYSPPVYASKSPISGPTTEQFDRLLALLALTEEERAFVRAAVADPQDKSLFAVLADYLEEQNMAKEALHFRKLRASQTEAGLT